MNDCKINDFTLYYNSKNLFGDILNNILLHFQFKLGQLTIIVTIIVKLNILLIWKLQ